MKESAERIKYITDYITSYKHKIELLNKEGLFDTAKMFELFAENILKLYFGYSFHNLNKDTFTFECVDLISDDGETFCQVSTCADVPAKIKKTLKMLKDTENATIKKIKKILFFVLDNESIAKVKDLTGKNKIGNIEFKKKDSLITTQNIIDKATKDLPFQIAIFDLLQKEECFDKNISRFRNAIKNSEVLMQNNINEFIGKDYSIDVSEIIQKIKAEKQKFIMISGQAGSGKSVICKRFCLKEKNVLFIRAEQMVYYINADDLWGFDIENILSTIKEEVYFFVDALEFMADNKNQFDILFSLLERINSFTNAYFMCSCRSSDRGAFIRVESEYKFKVYETEPINEKELKKIIKSFPLLKNVLLDKKLAIIFNTPFYINLLTQFDDINNIDNANELRKRIWEEKICNGSETRKETVKKIVLDRAINFLSGCSRDGYDLEVVKSLISDDVLTEDRGLIRLRYDIFEDICFERIIDERFLMSKGDYSQFFKQIETYGRCIYRRYQIWIENKLLAKEDRDKFLYSLLNSNSIPKEWEKQTIIGLIKSRYSDNFFSEYENDILSKGKLLKLIDLTNLYGFEINIILSDYGFLNLRCIGKGRENLINIIFKNKIYLTDEENRIKILKLVKDYSQSEHSNEKTARQSVEILVYYIEKDLSNSTSKYRLYDLIKDKVNALYRLHDYSYEWIKEFLLKAKNDFLSNDSESQEFAIDIINDLFSSNGYLALFFLNEFFDLYNIFYISSNNEKEKKYHYGNPNMDLTVQYGLNENAEQYEHNSFQENPLICSSFYSMFESNYWETLKWSIGFINQIVTKLNGKKALKTFDLYFIEENTHRSYLGNEDMWLAGCFENHVPLLLGDLIFILKIATKDMLDAQKPNIKEDMALRIKKEIYANSNNVMLLSVIAYIGLAFEKELPGYALDLITDINLVFFDLKRAVMCTESPTINALKKEIARKVGLNSLKKDRYANVIEREELRSYTLKCQVNHSQLVDKCHHILDYLYSIINNNSDEAAKHLQIQNMDIRIHKANAIDDKWMVLEPEISGEAKKLCDEQEETNEKYKQLTEETNKFIKLEKSNNLKFEDVKRIITTYLGYRNDQIFITISNALVSLIVKGLSFDSLDIEERNKLCNLWLDLHAEKNKHAIIIDSKFYSTLFSQIQFNIDKKVKNKIKLLILTSILSNDDPMQNDRDLTIQAQKYLSLNQEFAKHVFNTILLFSKDQMKHAIFNFNALLSQQQAKKQDFKPYLSGEFLGTDYYLTQYNLPLYKSAKKKIISKFLSDKEIVASDVFNIDEYDLSLLSRALGCGVNFSDETVGVALKAYVQSAIKAWNENLRYSSHGVLGVYELFEVRNILVKSLLNEATYIKTLDLLFSDIDFSLFKVETVEFYLETLCSITPFYFDAHSNTAKREFAEKLIRELETRIDKVGIKWIKNDLCKALIFGATLYNGARSSWDKCESGYSYKDKMFINEMFEKYGYLHLPEMLNSIYKMHYKKLLPEILISINKCMDDFLLKNGEGKMLNIYKDIRPVLNCMIYFSFSHFDEKIKCYNNLINAFENILLKCVSLGDEKAAILLDEFRVH